MAKYNEILVGRYNRALQKLLSMKGPSSLVTLSDELIPVFPFFWGAENRYLESWDRFGGSTIFTAAAGITGGWRLRNPAGSNIVAVVELLNFADNAGTGAIDFGAIGTDLAILDTTTTRLDPRGRSNSTLILSHATASSPTSFGTMWRPQLVAGTLLNWIFDGIQEFPLLPGDGLQYRCTAAATSAQANFIWRERFLEESERA